MKESIFFGQEWADLTKWSTYLTTIGGDQYKDFLAMTVLTSINTLAEFMEKLQEALRVEKSYYVSYSPYLMRIEPNGDRYPITEEGFTKMGKTYGGKDLYWRQGKIYVIQDDPEITNTYLYYSAAYANWALRMTSLGVIYLVDTLISASDTLKK